MDAFIYSPLLTSSQQGTQYSNLFHVSDWFPTIMDMAGISYDAPTGFSLDGVSHYSALANNDIVPRTYMLYNDYYNVDGLADDLWTEK